MVDSFGATLRALRQQNELSLEALAERTTFSAGYLGNIETGERAPTLGVAAACDDVFGCAPLLATLHSIERGDPMLRRALLGGTFAATSTALLATVDGTAALAAVLQSSLHDAIEAPTDWDALAASFARRHVLAPSPAFGVELAAQIAVAQHRVTAGDRDAARGAALLALTYGLWIADTGRVPTAHGLYATAAALADRSGDPATRALVRARAANRGIYEGWTADRAQATADEALAISTTGTAALEAHAARVHLHALTGNLSAGRAAVAQMRAAADSLPEAGGPTAHQRVASFHAYLECRAGSLTDAQRAFEQAERDLRQVPLWLADATIYMGRALVAAGDVTGGAQLTLDAVQHLPFSTRILGIGVRDVLYAAGRRRSDVLDVLRGYASPGPAPWETLT
jgi:transcriptional regulator with XRE-family HTH domain